MPAPLGLPPSTIVLIALVPLILWRFYRRFKRLVGRQRSKLWRHWTGAILFPLLIVLIAMPVLLHPATLTWLAAGIAAGVALAIVGLKHTRYEATPEGFFYTPNAHIGIALSLVMAARIGYRMLQMAGFSTADRATQMQDFTRSPLTLLIIGMIAAYYSAYAIGMIRWRSRTMVATPPAQETP
jgi:hypothetical protein